MEPEVTEVIQTGTKYDEDKARLDLIPHEFMFGMGQVYALGVKKYGARNWELGWDWGRSYAALERHLWAWWGGEDYSEDDHHHHLLAAAFNLIALYIFQKRKVGKDDRPNIPSRAKMYSNDPRRDDINYIG